MRDTASLPTGNVAILFTDIEGSTALWEQDGARMSQALAAHDALARSVVEGHRGRVVKMIGDGMHAVFDDALDALTATVGLQQALANPAATNGVSLRVRCGLHAGVVERRDDDYFGNSVNRAARIMSAAHGGQVLLSQVVVDGVRDRLTDVIALRDLGNVRLKDLSSPEHVYQVLHPQLRQDFPALRSLEATPNNLPQQATSFIGREMALADVRRLVARARTVTLTGSGGCGKTRLGLQVAADSLERFPDGAWLVELAPLADPALVPQTVATVLGLQEVPGKPIDQTLIEHLKDKGLLLLLDNCEHLLDACAKLADALVRQCPDVQILASSREGLGIAGEQSYRVPSLSLPDPKQAHTPVSVAPFEAVQLFTDRALLARSDFQITGQNASTLAAICYRLDGIPLAIELAAARVRSLSVEEINRKLDERFRLLTGGSRTALPRQQTLRSLIDWSYDLLTDVERALFRRLAVFAGGWTLEAAEQVCAGNDIDEAAVLDLLSSLVDKSLVVAEDRSGAMRYRLLETVRQYARDRLLESGEGGRWRDRHLEWFVAMAEEAEPNLAGAEQQAWLDRLETEHDNLRSALAWSAAEGAEAASGLRLAGALCVFWEVRGYLGEGRGWLAALLAAAPDGRTVARANALNGAGIMAWQQADYATARALHEECLAIRRELGNRRGIAGSLNNLGNIACERGDLPAARALYEESLAIKRELGDRRGMANSLNNLGIVACNEGDYPVAWALYTEGLTLRRELDDRNGIAHSLNNLGAVACEQGDYPVARALYEQSLAIHRDLGHRHGVAVSLNFMGTLAKYQGDFRAARELYLQGLTIWREVGDPAGIADSLEGLAETSLPLAGPDRAARIWAAAERLREGIGAPLPPSERPRHDRQVAAARAALGDDAAFDLAWQEGRALTLEQAMDIASAATAE